MIILCHRGCWHKDREQNSKTAFIRAFSLGFGVETDIRDYQGELVISHDIASKECIKAEQLFEIYRHFNKDLPLALNIKSDGLQNKLKQLIRKFKIKNYFVFDMSIPETLRYSTSGIKFFTRISEYEQVPCLYPFANGVWLDEFKRHWINKKLVLKYLRDSKKVCIVSPELHGRPYVKVWQEYARLPGNMLKNTAICTDFPEKADKFFNKSYKSDD